MKKIILFILLIITTSTFAASSDSLQTATVDTITVKTSNVQVLKKRADKAYTKGDYKKAAADYESLLKIGESASIYYNLGNSYYKLEQLGKAILNYEKALLMQPSNEDIQFNLTLARSKTVDKLKPLQRDFFTSLWQSIRDAMSSNTWAHLSIVCFLIVIASTASYVFGRKMLIRKLSFYMALCFLFFTLMANIMAKQQKEKRMQHDSAIVLVSNLTVRSTPDESGTELFVIHEGHKVKIKDASMTTWVEITIEDGNTGWVPVSAVERI
jgi:tetratricopeptide (TPR) repeat protein